MTEENELEIQLTKDELEIIDFINDLQIQLESENEEKIRKIVEEKYGIKGEQILNQLFEQIVDMDDCEDCGELPNDWTEEAKEKMSILEDFLNDDLDAMVSSVLNETQGGSKISMLIVKEVFAYHSKKKISEVTNEEVKPLCRKIMFAGIIEGWLIADQFK